MALHRLTSVTIGVPNVEETAAYYGDFGLTPNGDGTFETLEGGEQLRLVPAQLRMLMEMRIGADDPDDLDRIVGQLRGIDVDVERLPTSLQTRDPATGVSVVVEIASRLEQPSLPATPYNGPGRNERLNSRAPVLLREQPVQPRKLGHAVMGVSDIASSQRFFQQGIGFKVSDQVPGLGAFMRCSTDHHNLLLLSAPLNFLHHTSWQVDDLDDVGRGAMHMLEDHPERHVWGMGRHYIGSNFFWYLRDPAGNFTEYYSDMDCIVDDQLWKPEVFDQGPKSLFSWGPPPPPSFIMPEDLAAHMVGAHSQG
jgi:catechol 2,3-dioxygenase-like lactoylglutathione lyase family enzyme